MTVFHAVLRKEASLVRAGWSPFGKELFTVEFLERQASKKGV
jgi:hypothetical protein